MYSTRVVTDLGNCTSTFFNGFGRSNTQLSKLKGLTVFFDNDKSDKLLFTLFTLQNIPTYTVKTHSLIINIICLFLIPVKIEYATNTIYDYYIFLSYSKIAPPSMCLYSPRKTCSIFSIRKL